MRLETYNVDLFWLGTITDRELKGVITLLNGEKHFIFRVYNEKPNGIRYRLESGVLKNEFQSLSELLELGLGLSGDADELEVHEPAPTYLIQKALDAIAALNKLVLAGVAHPSVIQADMLLNTWFDSVIGENHRV